MPQIYLNILSAEEILGFAATTDSMYTAPAHGHDDGAQDEFGELKNCGRWQDEH